MFDEMQDQKTRTTEDYWAMVQRQRWVILVPIFVCWLLVWGIGWLVPSSYKSTAEIKVDPQLLSPTLVEPNSIETPEAELDSVYNSVINESRLQTIIEENHLYSRHSGVRALLDPSDPVLQMRKDIQIVPVGGLASTANNRMPLTAFLISYTSHSPEAARAITGELTDLFVQQNNSTQSAFSQQTTGYLSTQLEQAQANLQQQEDKIKAFKAAKVGELPDQVQSNLQILSGLQQQLQATDNALSTAQGQKLYLQSIIQQYQSAQSDLGTSDSAVSPSSLDKQIKDLEMQLAQERSQYTDNYPDVVALKEQIEKTKELKKQTEAQIAAEHKADKGTDDMAAGAANEVQNGAPTPMMQIQSQLKSNQLQIQSLEAAQKSLQAKIDEKNAQLNAAPGVEQQLSEISRGYDEANTYYNTLKAKSQSAQLASDVPNGQQGTYTVISSATLPAVPSAPNHLLISLGGLAAGIVIGIGLAALLELTDMRIRKEADLEGLVSARVLVGIPNMTTPAENRRHAMLRWVERGVVLAMLVIVVVGNIYSFYRG